jgi:hypothetical protein
MPMPRGFFSWGGVAASSFCVRAAVIAASGLAGLGWDTAAVAESPVAPTHMTAAQSAAAVAFCVAKAEQPSESRALSEFQASHSRVLQVDIVQRTGWAASEGRPATDAGLAKACSAELAKLLKTWRFVAGPSVAALPSNGDALPGTRVRAISR